MTQLRKEMASRGVRGISGIGRRFKIADDNQNGSLCYDEFKKVMQECAIELSEQDCRQLFDHFDKDKKGDLDYEEFLVTLRVSEAFISIQISPPNVLFDEGCDE